MLLSLASARIVGKMVMYLTPIFPCIILLSCDSGPVTGEVFETDSLFIPDPSIPESERLLWPAPAYTITVRVPYANHQQDIYLKNAYDYRVVLPGAALTHRVNIRGGRNILIVGGAFKLKGYSDTVTNRAALAFNDENAIFQVQNVRFQNVNGDHTGLHPDAIENWGGAKEVRIYNATVITNHQGFLLSPLQPTQTNPIEHVDIRQVDFRRNAGVYGSYPNHKCPIYLWLVHYQQETCFTYPRGAYLREIYATHAENCWDFGMNDTVPNTIQPAGCLAEVNADATEISWPAFPFDGVVKQGPPPAGEFVPEGVAGIGYRSPGYRTN